VTSRISELLASLYKRVRTFWMEQGWIVVLIGLPFMLPWDAFIVMGPWVNMLDRQDWKCEVVSAEPRVGGAGLRGGSSNAFVVVQTKNCGEILVDGSSVSFDNNELVAASFDPGSKWIFEVGWFARNYSMKIERVLPTVEYYHRIS